MASCRWIPIRSDEPGPIAALPCRRYIKSMNARPVDRLAIAIAQLNPVVGDIAGNAE
jgi:hypothetical protein